MSEPLTSSEIEDVLSSIRRLVSDDIRPMGRSAPPAPAVPAAPVVARVEDKLLLTPAFRVVQNVRQNDNGWLAEHVEPTRESVEQEEFGKDAMVTRLGAQVPAFSDEWENEEGDAVLADAGVHAEAGRWEDFSASDAFEEDAFLAGAGSSSKTPDVTDVVEPEEILPHHQYEDESKLFAPERADEQIPGWAQSEFEDDASEDMGDLEDSLETKEVAFVSARSTAWADAAEASVIAALAMQERPNRIHRAASSEFVEDAPPEPHLQAASDAGELRFDEDILRELVRDLIREELQGKLGERMTRSMRKLVRVELLRLLATREFEE